MILLKKTLKISWSSRLLPYISKPITFSTNNISTEEPLPLRSRKKKSTNDLPDHFVDSYSLETIGGKGGDGCVSFLRLYANDKAGPDGGDGGNGGHVIFRASNSVHDLCHLKHTMKADDGERGNNKDCTGKNAKHCFVDVPVGTIVKNSNGIIVGDLRNVGSLFIAARGGSGGKGNHFFATDTNQAPMVAQVGAKGETVSYKLEIRSMAHFGLVGLPNAGKSTLLRAITRARPMVAGYEFTTLRPYIGVVEFSDYEKIYVADLPGLIEGSHRNEGLGIQFLQHTERCLGLLYIIDLSRDDPLSQLDVLQNEISTFSSDLATRPYIIIGNKIDLDEAQTNLLLVETETSIPVVPISAKTGKNLTNLLRQIRKLYDERIKNKEKNSE